MHNKNYSAPPKAMECVLMDIFKRVYYLLITAILFISFAILFYGLFFF